MAKFCVCIKDELPAEECLVEAANADEAIDIRARDLVDWADAVNLKAEPVDEAKRKGKKS